MTDNHVSSALSLTVILAFIWGVFKLAESVASPALKGRVTQWLKSPNPAEVVAGWLPTFVEVFDRLFGERHLSWRCFRRPCLASLGAVVVVTLYWAATRPKGALTFLVSGRMTPFAAASGSTAISFFVLTIMVGLIPDYLSLLKSRRLIGWMNRRPRIRRLLLGVALDLWSTLVLVWLSWYVFFLLNWTLHFGWHSPSVAVVLRMQLWMTAAAMYYSYSLSAAPGDLPVGIWAWAALFTAVWAALYAFAGALLKLALYVGTGLRGVLWALDIDGKPIESLGVVSVGVVAVLYVVGAIAGWIMKG